MKNLISRISLFSLVAFLSVHLSVSQAFAVVPVTPSFKDVPVTHSNYKAIEYLKNKGIVSGYPDGTFHPDEAVKRAEAVKIISNAAGIVSTTAPAVNNFKDTSKSEWYWIYLATAVNKGIVSGYSDGTFKPSQTVNLVENLKMLLLAKGVNTQSIVVAQNPYTDAYKTQWYVKYVQYAKDKNLIDADSLNKIYPAQGLTRGKLAEMVYRLLYIQENNLFSYTKDKVLSGVVEVNIENFMFPDTITITKGTKVRWTNKDTSSHSVVSNDKKFDSGKLTQGKSFEFTFTQAGTYDYHCAIHPLMKGKVVVQ